MSVQILVGDARTRLAELPDQSVHCAVTSPPYFGLRCYGHPDQMGLEPTPDEYAAGMVALFREVRRVLRDDGTLWLNLGDSYTPVNYGPNAKNRRDSPNSDKTMQGKAGHWASDLGGKLAHDLHKGCRSQGIKNKDLVGIPWRVAFALQADGWYLRQDIIWSKPNPMPESVRDRCTKAHEYLFLLSKSPRYYFDAEAIAEPISQSTVERWGGAVERTHEIGTSNEQRRQLRGENTCGNNGVSRNKRSVWEVATQPFSEAHFATYPPALIEPCIKAGCPDRCCAKCGAPVERVVTKGEPNEEWKARCGADKSGGYNGNGKDDPSGKAQNPSDLKRRILEGMRHKEHSFQATCDCDAGTVPGTVLDPFGGAGTTGLVADRLGRNAILIELNPEYAAIAERRLRNDGGMFAEVMAA